MKCLVLDYGGTFVKYSVMDENKERSQKGEVPAPISCVEEFEKTTKELIAKFENEVEGITISFPGFVNSDTTWLGGGGAYSILHNTYLKDVFSKCTKLPFVIENDGKCGALAEAWGGALEGVSSGIVIIFGTGIAGGLIQNGKIYKGVHGTAGELSFLTLDWGMQSQYTAQFVISASMLIAKVKYLKGKELTGFEKIYEAVGATANWKKGEKDAALDGVEIDGIKLFELLEAGDLDVKEIYDEFCRSAAAAILNLQCVYDPERFAIGGGISRQDRLVPDVIAALESINNMLMNTLPKSEIVRCHYQGDANQYGAMYHFLTKYHSELL